MKEEKQKEPTLFSIEKKVKRRKTKQINCNLNVEFLPNDLPVNQAENESSIIQLMLQIVNIGIRINREKDTYSTIINKGEQK